jgi:hypothetical protein
MQSTPFFKLWSLPSWWTRRQHGGVSPVQQIEGDFMHFFAVLQYWTIEQTQPHHSYPYVKLPMKDCSITLLITLITFTFLCSHRCVTVTSTLVIAVIISQLPLRTLALPDNNFITRMLYENWFPKFVRQLYSYIYSCLFVYKINKPTNTIQWYAATRSSLSDDTLYIARSLEYSVGNKQNRVSGHYAVISPCWRPLNNDVWKLAVLGVEHLI